MLIFAKEVMGSVNNKNNNSGKPFIENGETGKLAKYAKASYFLEKDKKAREFLKKHPIPSQFLK